MTVPAQKTAFDVARVRQDFPALSQKVHGRDLVFLDHAASSQTPTFVVDALDQAYRHDRSNIHRGVHTLSQRATTAYEAARGKLRSFIGAARESEIVFVRGTTEAINLVAQTHGRQVVQAGDNIVVSVVEHHSNIVPWQMLALEQGAELRVLDVDEAGDLRLDLLPSLLDARTKIVALGHVSNALGSVHPVKDIIRTVRQACPAAVLLDGAQAVPHLRVDVQDLDVDFYAFSGHKMCGPTGIGVLYGKRSRLEAMPPWQGGGDMIEKVSFAGTTYAAPPSRFEAGTPHIAGGIGLGAAVDYLQQLDFDKAMAHEHEVVAYAVKRLAEVRGLRLIGTPKARAGAVSFVIDQDGMNLHPMDIGTLLDKQGIAVRTGHHCAEPIMERYGISGTTRASFSFTNTLAEVDALKAALDLCVEMLA